MKIPAEELLVGAHCSAAGGVHNALLAGKEIGATTIQLFTSNQRQWHSRTLTPEMIDQWNVALLETGMREVMSHDSYLINLGSPHSETLAKSRAAFRQEVERCTALGLSYLNFHPGAALDDSEEACLERIVKSLLLVEDLINDSSLTLLLETTAGQGSSVGYRFEHLQAIISQVHRRIPIGVCIDTCHIFAAGYDIRDEAGWKATLKEFDQLIGLNYLRAFHMNDSKQELGSRVDRHAPLGKGKIGLDCFRFMMTHPKLRTIPKYLETPDPGIWTDEIALLRSFAK